MFDYIKMKATKAQRIRVGSEKKNIKKWEIVEVRKNEIPFFITYWFIEVKMEDKKVKQKTTKNDIVKKKTKK